MAKSETKVVVDPVDEKLPAVRLVPLALQHVLVMYAGAVAVPLILGRALKLSPEEVAFLISADLFACGIATIVQSFGFPGVGIRLPVMMGVTFASVGPMLAMAATPGVGLLGIYGSVIAAGVFGILVAPFVSRLLPLFPAVVTGTIILVIGISLMRVGINWAGGGLPSFGKVVDGVMVQVPNPAYGGLAGPRHRAVRAADHSGADQMGQGLRAECRGADRHCRRRYSRGGSRHHAFRKSRHREVGRHRAAVPFRRTGISPGADRDHVHRHDRGDDRIARHVPGARRNHRQERSTKRP